MPGTTGPHRDDYTKWMKTFIEDLIRLKPKKIIVFLGHDGATQQKVFGALKEEFPLLDFYSSATSSKIAQEKEITTSPSVTVCCQPHAF